MLLRKVSWIVLQSCLMSNQVSLDMVSRGKGDFCYSKELIHFFFEKASFYKGLTHLSLSKFLFIGFVSTRLACRRRKKHVRCCKSMCMWKYLSLLSGAYCLEGVRPSCNLHYGQISKKDPETKLFLNLKNMPGCLFLPRWRLTSWRSHATLSSSNSMHLPNLPIFVVPFSKQFHPKIGLINKVGCFDFETCSYIFQE